MGTIRFAPSPGWGSSTTTSRLFGRRRGRAALWESKQRGCSWGDDSHHMGAGYTSKHYRIFFNPCVHLFSSNWPTLTTLQTYLSVLNYWCIVVLMTSRWNWHRRVALPQWLLDGIGFNPCCVASIRRRRRTWIQECHCIDSILLNALPQLCDHRALTTTDCLRLLDLISTSNRSSPFFEFCSFTSTTLRTLWKFIWIAICSDI